MKILAYPLMLCNRFLCGFLGGIISYRMVTVIFAAIGFFMAILLIVKKRVYIEPIYVSKKDA